MSAQFTAEEESLYFETGEAVLRQLRKTKRPTDLLGVIRSAFSGFDRAYESASDVAKSAVACRSGCGACCHEKVAAQAHEVLIAAEHIQRNFSPEALEEIIERTSQHRDAFSGRNDADWIWPRTACVALRDGACSIYEGRPESCRSHHSHSASACQANLDAGNQDIDVHVPGVRGRMFAVMLGIDQAVENARFDDRAYDFGSALHEALTDSLCAVRWMQRKPAFPDSCLE